MHLRGLERVLVGSREVFAFAMSTMKYVDWCNDKNLKIYAVDIFNRVIRVYGNFLHPLTLGYVGDQLCLKSDIDLSDVCVSLIDEKMKKD